MLRALLAAATEPVPLPAGPAGPLHFPAPPSCAWLVVWFLLVAGLLVWLGRLLWRRLRRYLQTRQSPPRAPVGQARRPGIGSVVAKILQRHLAAGSYRQGCHDLSAALRSHWEERGLVGTAAHRLTYMTAREIGGRVGDRPATRLLTNLSELQFGRRPPTRRQFESACELAGKLVAKGAEG